MAAVAAPAQPLAPKPVDPNALAAAAGTGIAPPPNAQNGIQSPALGQGATPVTPPPATTTFSPPATGITNTAAIASQPDPKIAALITQLTQQAATPAAAATPVNLAPPDFSGTNAQSASLRTLLGTLAAGQGINTPDMSKDPAAIAYNTTRTRAGEQQRQAEADRAAASGVSGSGDFDARVAQINEAVGTDEAANAANLTNQRRAEGIQEAETAANLQLGQIGQDTAQAQSKYSDSIAQQQLQQARDNSAQQAGQFDRSSNQSLLAALLGEQGMQQGRADTNAATTTELARQINPATGLPYGTTSSSLYAGGGVSSNPAYRQLLKTMQAQGATF